MPTKGINSAIVALEIELLRYEQMLERSVSNNEVFLKIKIIQRKLKEVSKELNELNKLQAKK